MEEELRFLTDEIVCRVTKVLPTRLEEWLDAERAEEIGNELGLPRLFSFNEFVAVAVARDLSTCGVDAVQIREITAYIRTRGKMASDVVLVVPVRARAGEWILTNLERAIAAGIEDYEVQITVNVGTIAAQLQREIAELVRRGGIAAQAATA